jgi:hypothetical protein
MKLLLPSPYLGKIPYNTKTTYIFTDLIKTTLKRALFDISKILSVFLILRTVVAG